jgi:uncharacterized protein YlxP (DUF503 family)
VVVLSCQVQVYLPESRSLKDKRQVVTSLKERIRGRFNVSVAEVDHHDLWQRATLGFAAVSTAMDHASEVLSKAVRLIEHDGRVQVLDCTFEAC